MSRYGRDLVEIQTPEFLEEVNGMLSVYTLGIFETKDVGMEWHNEL